MALGVGDTVIMLENAVYSVISPEGCASILWKDSSKAADAADVLKLTSNDLLTFGVIEKVITEENRSAQEICTELKKILTTELTEKCSITAPELLDKRYHKFRKIGM